MKQNYLTPSIKLYGLLLASLLFLALAATAYAQEPTKKDPFACNPGEICIQATNQLQLTGDPGTEGSLQITVYQEGTMFVERRDSGSWVAQIFAISKGSKLHVDGADYSFGYYSGTQLPTFSHTKTGDQIVTSWKPASNAFVVTQTTNYINPNPFYQLQWDIVNTSGSTLSDLRFYHGEDTYLKGGDNGAGFWEAASNSIGVQKTASGELQRMTLQGTTPPFAYCSQTYSSCESEAIASALSNTIDPNESTDNGYALEWRKASLGPGETWRIVAYEKFVSGNIGAVIVSAPVNTDCQPGQPCTLTYQVTNITGSPANVSLSLAGTESWGQAISSPSSPVSIAAGATQNVVVTLTVPGGTAEGTTAGFTLTANDGAVDASDTGSVTVVTPHTLNVFKAGAGSGTVTSSGSSFINCGSDCIETFSPNDSESVTLVASPTAYSVFDGWSGACSGTGNCSVLMSASRDVTATFSPEPAQITGQAPPTGEYGAPYDYHLVSTGQPPLTYTLTGGSLPPGLNLETEGRLDGTPTQAGTFGPFTVQVETSYDSASKPFTITINKAPLQVVAIHTVITQGQAIPDPLPYTFKGFRLGDTAADLQNTVVTYTTTATDSNIVGDYDISCPDPATLPAEANYILTCISNKLKITDKLVPVVTWTPAVTQLVYGTPVGASVLNATANVPGTFTYRANGSNINVNTVLPVGNGEIIELDFFPTDSVSYKEVVLLRQINITRAPLTITADDKTVAVGGSLPTLTASYSGFVNGEGPADLDQPVQLSTPAHPDKEGLYTIFANSASDPNYVITFVNGQLEVKKLDNYYLPIIFKN